jgi:mercuric ion transport protein
MAVQVRSIMGEKGFFAALPVVGAALLPKLVCAACWPAYTAFLGAAGIEFVNYTPYLLPLTGVGLVIAVGSLGLLARRRRRIEPFLLGLAAAVAVLVGKFVLESSPVLYVGIGMLMVASLVPWRSKVPSCCASD